MLKNKFTARKTINDFGNECLLRPIFLLFKLFVARIRDGLQFTVTSTTFNWIY